MAGDWIKMRSDLFTHPKVVRMSSALKADTLRTIGGLMSAWCLFDAHSEDGKLDGYTPETLDDHLRWPGFSAAMINVHWLVFDISDGGESLALPEFDTHNGQSAKRRAQDADRKKNVRKMSASEADKKRTREEKRREELIAIPLSLGAGANVEVIDGETGQRATPPQSVIGTPSTEKPAQLAMACRALRKMGAAPRIHPGDEQLASLMAEGFTAEQVVRVVGEKALHVSQLWDDPDLNPDLFDLLINGATQQGMGLTDKQHAALRSGVAQVSIGYIAAALRGRRDDAKTTSSSPRRGPERRPHATDNLKGKSYEGTPTHLLPPELRAAVERLG